MALVTVHYPGHDGDLNKSANVPQSLRKRRIISSVHIVFTGPDDRRRILFQNLISCLARIQLVVLFLSFKIGGVKFIDAREDTCMLAPVTLVDLQSLLWHTSTLVREHPCMNKQCLNHVQLVRLGHQIGRSGYNPTTATYTRHTHLIMIDSKFCWINNHIIDGIDKILLTPRTFNLRAISEINA